ncbi:MAG: hypothetical protein ABWY12_09710 [Burkholderiales bacterium]
MTVIRVRPQDVAAQWKLALGFLHSAIAWTGGRFTPATVLADLELGRSQLWAAVEDAQLYAVAVTQILIYPGGESVGVLYLGGVDSERWGDLLTDALLEYARERNCQRLELFGRKGWERKLPGWNLVGVWLEKEVDDGRLSETATNGSAGSTDPVAPVAG